MFLKSQEDAFINKMVKHLKENFRNDLQKNEIRENELENLIRIGLGNGYRYGIIYEDDMSFFLECTAILGPGFDKNEKYPKIAEILNNKDLAGSDKIDQISDFLTFELSQPA
ncbi:MAG: hypothetical protein K0B08_00745 [Bacteroidales bacterium]|nr:hypothetical protein [Bacteroidales bacterium]